VRLMTIVAALVGTAALMSEWARRGMLSGGSSSRDSRRSRGKDGGASGVELTRNPLGLARARENRVGGYAVDQSRLRPLLHRRSARAAGQPEGRLLVGPLRVASTDADADRGAQRDGVSGEDNLIAGACLSVEAVESLHQICRCSADERRENGLHRQHEPA